MKISLIVLIFIIDVKCYHKYSENTLTCDFEELEKYIKPGNVGDRVFIYITFKFSLKISLKSNSYSSNFHRNILSVTSESGPNGTVTEHIISQHFIITLKEISLNLSVGLPIIITPHTMAV